MDNNFCRLTVEKNTGNCDYKSGPLPDCAPLAASYVPMQQEGAPKYGADEALTRGTLFPGLDLPFMNIVNKTNPYAGTPLGEVMAIDFVIKELNLYLDTHPDDQEAFAMLKEMIGLSKEARTRYVKRFGPITISDLEYCNRFSWIDDPWPWDYKERIGK